MGKKLVTMLGALVLLCGISFFASSCAKKEVTVSEPVQSTTAQEGRVEQGEQGGESGPVTVSDAERQRRLRELEGQQASVEGAKEFENKSIYFDFDRADLTPEAQAVLKKKAEWLRNHASYSVLIQGHTDERGTDEYNLALGERRASSAKKFLEALGIPSGRISTISYGEERPADPAHNEDAWAKNRRDEFKLYK